MMADWMPTTERGSAQGTVWMSSRLGGFIAPLLIVWLFQVMGGADLRLMSSTNGVSEVPAEGKNLLVVADVDHRLHFRIFDSDGKMVVDTDERLLTEQARKIEELRNQIESLWPPHELTGSEKRRVIAAVGSIVGYTLLGDWKLSLVLVAGLGLLWCLVFWPWFRNQPEEMPQVNQAERKLIESGRGVQGGHGHGPVPWAKMARSPSVWALCGMYGFLGFSGNFYLTLLPTYLKNHRLLDSTTMGWLSGLPFGFGVIACFTGGWFSDAIIRRWGKRWGRRIVGADGPDPGGFGDASGPLDSWDRAVGPAPGPGLLRQ